MASYAFRRSVIDAEWNVQLGARALLLAGARIALGDDSNGVAEYGYGWAAKEDTQNWGVGANFGTANFQAQRQMFDSHCLGVGTSAPDPNLLISEWKKCRVIPAGGNAEVYAHGAVLGGRSLRAQAGFFEPSIGGGGGDYVVSLPGFGATPQLIFLLTTAAIGAFGSEDSAFGQLAAATPTDSWSLVYLGDFSSAGAISGFFRDCVLIDLFGSAPYAFLSSVADEEFTITFSGAWGSEIAYLALADDSADAFFEVGYTDASSATISGLPDTPEVVIAAATAQTAFDTVAADATVAVGFSSPPPVDLQTFVAATRQNGDYSTRGSSQGLHALGSIQAYGSDHLLDITAWNGDGWDQEWDSPLAMGWAAIKTSKDRDCSGGAVPGVGGVGI